MAPAEPSSNALPIILVALVAIAVGGYFMFRGGPEEPARPPATTAPETTVTDDGEGVAPGEGVEGEAPEVAPTEEVAPEPAAAPETEQAEVATDQAEVAPEPPPSPPVSFRVETTPPGAEIRVAGEVRGTSPATVEAPAGEVILVAHLDGYRDATTTVTVAEGQRPVRLALEALPYQLEVVTTPPGATVRVGGRTGTSPATLAITRPTRETRVTASLAGHTPGSATVAASAFVAAGDTMSARVEIALVRAPTPPPDARRPAIGAARREPAGGAGAGGDGNGASAAPDTRPQEAPPENPF